MSLRFKGQNEWIGNRYLFQKDGYRITIKSWKGRVTFPAETRSEFYSIYTFLKLDEDLKEDEKNGRKNYFDNG